MNETVNTRVDHSAMTVDEIEDRIIEVAECIASIKSQLENAKSRAARDKEYSNSDWFNRARYSLRKYGIEHQILMRELGKRKKQSTEGNDFYRMFFEVVKSEFEKDLLDDLIHETNDRLNTSNK